MRHVVLCGLGYGDEGKGSVTSYLCRTGEYSTVVRYNGGPNTGHNVVLSDGRHHTFSQFGSGTFTPAVRTHLSRFMLVDPVAMAAEWEHLKMVHVSDALDRLTIDGEALLVTPWHMEANRLRERLRGANRHGSCGTGLGETRSYALHFPELAPRVRDCLDPKRLVEKLSTLRIYLETSLDTIFRELVLTDVMAVYTAFPGAVKIVQRDYLRQILDDGPAVFEGAQGVLLDEAYGFPPHNTWTKTTFKNAQTLLAEAGHEGFRLGVTRTYMTRHGAGPFVTEDSGLSIPDHNVAGPWQGAFRLGHFDAVALRYALRVAGGADGIALTHTDTARQHDLKVCHAYTTIERGHIVTLPVLGVPQPPAITSLVSGAIPLYRDPYLEWPKLVSNELGVPVVLESAGPSAAQKLVPPNTDLTW